MARNILPCHPINCNRILPLHRRRLEDRSWEIRSLHQPRPCFRCADLFSPTRRKFEPLDRCQFSPHTRWSAPGQPASEELRFLSPFLILLTSREHEERYLFWAYTFQRLREVLRSVS